MLINEQRFRSDVSNWVRRCLAVTAFVTLGLTNIALANISRSQPGLAATPFEILIGTAEVNAAGVVYVTTIEELYAAVNNPANAGAAIILSPGTYVLSASGPGGVARPNAGRLELQQDMTLSGLAGDRSGVVIDTSALPVASFNVPFGRTASIRLGRGSNAVDWLTIKGNTAAAGGIETELPGTLTTLINVAHVVSGGSSRGVDVRNVGAANAGRRIEAQIVDSDLSSAPEAAGQKEALRIANFAGADGGQIYVSMSGNRIHDTEIGAIIANNRSSAAAVDVRSEGNSFEHNGVGCVIAGAINLTGTGVTNSSSTTFEAHNTRFVDAGGPAAIGRGGIAAFGVDNRAANTAANNAVQIRLWGCIFSNNEGKNIEAFGARNLGTGGPSGTNNTVTIEMHDVSAPVFVTATDSLPAEPGGTNKVIVLPVVKARDIMVEAGDSCAAAVSPSEVDDGSYDPRDGDVLAFALDPAGPFAPGVQTVTLTATNNRGISASDVGAITVVDQTPPAITGAAVDTPTLLPPHHQMVDVTVSYTATDNCGAVEAALGVTSNEPVSDTGDGQTAPDWEIVDPHHVRLRAERSGHGNGRVYTITITASDGHGNVSSQTVYVSVPHN